ncbi:MAG: sodium ion-translocating decarboxylase subunit beta, partial [Pseudomonadota bacterium]
MERLNQLWSASGLAQMNTGSAVMLAVSLLLLYLAINRRFEPLLLVPIGFGGLLANIPGAGLALTGLERALLSGDAEIYRMLASTLATAPAYESLKAAIADASIVQLLEVTSLAADFGFQDGMLYSFYSVAIGSGVAPLVIFMGVGAMTDFGPMLANPRTLFLGAAAQFGIFATILGAVGLTELGITDFSLRDAAAIGIIGGADGPTAIYVASVLAPELLGAIAVAAYSYMALVPLIQPPIMRLLTTEAERQIEMVQLREVTQRERIVFPIMLLLLVALLLPDAAPLLGMLCLGNLMRECGVVERLSSVAQNA